MRPGQLITAVTLAGFGICAAALLVLHLWRPEIPRVTPN